MVEESNYIWRCLRKRPVTCLTVCGMTICVVYLLITVFVYSETGTTNDEATYIFHAKTFAAWRLTNPIPHTIPYPLAHFFQVKIPVDTHRLLPYFCCKIELFIILIL